MSEILTLHIAEILKILPHRYPFLLVDRVTEMVPGERVKAYKNLTFNEPFFLRVKGSSLLSKTFNLSS